MSDWTDRWAGHDRRDGVMEPPRDTTEGQPYGNAAPPPARTAPLPGMPSPTAPGRTDAGRPPAGHRTRSRVRGGDGDGGGSRSVYDRGRRSPKPRPTRRRRLARWAILVVSAVIASFLGTYVWADTRLNQEVDLGAIAQRAPRGEGTNYLVVGSDSREGLSEQARKQLRTGTAEGRRTDSMILLHTGANGTTMMSLPRDSWVTIPPYVRPETGKNFRAAKNKLNAAFSLGGPDLLVRTVEFNTGLHIDHYAEIGFAGFVGVVNAVGGVDMCLDRAVKDEKSGADLQKGCQTLDGTKALAFVRQRKQEAKGDLGRTQNQQKFLAALAKKAASRGTLLNPSKAFPTAAAGLDTLIVDKSTGLRELMSLFEAMQRVTAGNGRQLNVPVSDTNFVTSKGSAVRWDDRKARKLFTELRDDQAVTLQPEQGS
ncbi:LytR family transcriptional regulator [Streptomyces montanus]|uniref:LytR family transcriptional regulator n=1 Tax=Streptomyces montanus TaxID=2580423 RepID=A0A5R9FX54_9ACTN|nr:LCP family protein [Streptomyces montanus]TLS45443.1 LytR family transcriptional regulator [Streptomyces montanus]